MSEEELESWLRNELPSRDNCSLPEGRIQDILRDFKEDQASVERWERLRHLQDRMIDQRMIYREVTADEFIEPAELLFLCNHHSEWQSELDGILDYLDEYRRLEPGAAEGNSALTEELESETRKLLVWMVSVDAKCSPQM